jgi:hypothetical protein
MSVFITLGHDPVDSILIGVKLVKTLLIPDEYEDDQADGYADGQPRDRNNRIGLIVDQASVGGLEVIFKHGSNFELGE